MHPWWSTQKHPDFDPKRFPLFTEVNRLIITYAAFAKLRSTYNVLTWTRLNSKPFLSGLSFVFQADKLDTMLNSLHASTQNVDPATSPPVLYFSTWLLYHVLRLMIRYILSGFELELFSVHEFPYLYWYLYELLYPWLTTCLHKADGHLLEYEQFLENQNKTQGECTLGVCFWQIRFFI